MPRLQIGDQVVDVRRLTLSTREVATVLWPEDDPDVAFRRVQNLVRSGKLSDVSVEGSRTRLDPEELVAFIGRGIDAGDVSHRSLLDLAALVATPRR